jgi:hypothetical protein
MATVVFGVLLGELIVAFWLRVHVAVVMALWLKEQL